MSFGINLNKCAISIEHKTYLQFFLFLTSSLFLGQADKISKLYKAVPSKDRLLFEVGLNTCVIKSA